MTTTEEGRLGRLEGILEEIRARLSSLDTRMNGLEARMTALETRMQTQFLWLLGVILVILFPMWITIIVALLLRT